MATKIHPPAIIFVMLGLLVLTSSFLAGYAMAGSRSHQWIHSACFAVIIAMTVYIILDIEYPLVGLIRIEAMIQTLVELRQSMSAP
jgi:hypothetical protein